VSFAKGDCPANSAAITVTSSGTAVTYCICNDGYDCSPKGAPQYCGSYMQNGNVGFPADACPLCQCLRMFYVNSVDLIWKAHTSSSNVPVVSGLWVDKSDMRCFSRFPVVVILQFGNAVVFPVNGNGNMKCTIAGNTITGDCSLTLSGDRLTGTCQPSCAVTLVRNSTVPSGNAFSPPPTVGGTYSVSASDCLSRALYPPTTMSISQQSNLLSGQWIYPVYSYDNGFTSGTVDAFGTIFFQFPGS